MNELFKGTNDKLNMLSAVLLYIYRCGLVGRDYDKKMLSTYIDNVRSKSFDINEIKNIIRSMMNEKLSITTLTDLITLNLPEDSKIVNRLLKLIREEHTEKELNNYVIMMAEMISESANMLELTTSVNNTSFMLNTKDLSVDEQKEKLTELRTSLEKLDDINRSKTSKDANIMESVSIMDGGVAKSLEKDSDGTRLKLKTGWSKLNTGLGGCLYTGQLVAVQAMQHKNKTGFTLSLFLQTMLNNEIKLPDGKKPVWLWISLEDDLTQIITKIYIYLYFRENRTMPNMLEATSTSVSDYVMNTLGKTGIRLELLRIDGFKFSRAFYENIIRGYEVRGMQVVVTAVDYLEKAQVDAAALNTGATGSGLKNMMTSFRNYIQENNILFITPHQLATNANDILRGGVSDSDFLPLIVGKNFTQGSRGLSQEFDVEILIHLCSIAGIHYQAVQIGKLKGTSYVNAADKYMLIPFESNKEATRNSDLAPLMEDCSATNPIKTNDLDGSDGGIDL